jgi:hypothetical protein
MGWFKTDPEEEYKRGQEDGSKAGPLDQMAHDLNDLALQNTEDYNKGWENGIKNQPKD